MNIESALHMINMAVEYILVALVILVCIRFIGIRNSYASALNDKSALQKEVNNNLEYREYNTGTNQNDPSEYVPGSSVVAAIRKYKDGRINICVYNSCVTDSSGNIISFGDRDVALDKDTAISKSYEYTVSHLQKDGAEIIKSTDYYHPYLVYDNDSKDMNKFDSKGIEVTGIIFVKEPDSIP